MLVTPVESFLKKEGWIVAANMLDRITFVAKLLKQRVVDKIWFGVIQSWREPAILVDHLPIHDELAGIPCAKQFSQPGAVEDQTDAFVFAAVLVPHSRSRVATVMDVKIVPVSVRLRKISPAAQNMSAAFD